MILSLKDNNLKQQNKTVILMRYPKLKSAKDFLLELHNSKDFVFAANFTSATDSAGRNVSRTSVLFSKFLGLTLWNYLLSVD